MKTMISATNLIACAIVAGAFTVGFLSGPALAQEHETTPFDFDFTFKASELSNAPQAEKMLVRLESAVKRECGANGKMSYAERKLVETCINTTMRASIAKFNSATVAQAYQSRADG